MSDPSFALVSQINSFIGPADKDGITIRGMRLEWWSPIHDFHAAACQVFLTCVHFFGVGIITFCKIQTGACEACADPGVDCATVLPEGCVRLDVSSVPVQVR